MSGTGLAAAFVLVVGVRSIRPVRRETGLRVGDFFGATTADFRVAGDVAVGLLSGAGVLTDLAAVADFSLFVGFLVEVAPPAWAGFLVAAIALAGTAGCFFAAAAFADLVDVVGLVVEAIDFAALVDVFASGGMAFPAADCFVLAAGLSFVAAMVLDFFGVVVFLAPLPDFALVVIGSTFFFSSAGVLEAGAVGLDFFLREDFLVVAGLIFAADFLAAGLVDFDLAGFIGEEAFKCYVGVGGAAESHCGLRLAASQPELQCLILNRPAEKSLRRHCIPALIRRNVSDTGAQTNSPARSKESFLIYIVDDEPTLLELAEYILEMEGYRYEKFEEPKKALAAFQSADPKPDLIITDFVMLGMDGLQLVGECQRIKPDLKSILISGTVQEEVVERSSTRVDSFLRKPYLAQEFLSTVGGVLNTK